MLKKILCNVIFLLILISNNNSYAMDSSERPIFEPLDFEINTVEDLNNYLSFGFSTEAAIIKAFFCGEKPSNESAKKVVDSFFAGAPQYVRNNILEDPAKEDCKVLIFIGFLVGAIISKPLVQRMLLYLKNKNDKKLLRTARIILSLSTAFAVALGRTDEIDFFFSSLKEDIENGPLQVGDFLCFAKAMEATKSYEYLLSNHAVGFIHKNIAKSERLYKVHSLLVGTLVVFLGIWKIKST